MSDTATIELPYLLKITELIDPLRVATMFFRHSSLET